MINPTKEPVTIHLDYDSNGATQHPDFESTIIPGKGDVVRVSGSRFKIREVEFYLDHGRIDSVYLYLDRDVED